MNFKTIEKDFTTDDIASAKEILQKNPWYLIFPKKLENHFQQHYANTFLGQMRLAIIVSFLLLTMCGIIDMIYSPVLELRALSHIVLAMPLLGAISIFAFSERFKKYQQITLILFACILFLDIIWVAYDLKQPYEDLFYGSIAIVELFLLLLMRIQCKYLVPLILLLYLVYNAILAQDKINLGFVFFMYNYFFVAAAGLGVLSNYYFEKTFRHDYLQQVILYFDGIYNKQIQLGQRDSVKYDDLTGLNNYHYFHEQLELEWRRALRHQYPLTMLIIDVDYFNKFRESYGHSAGDVLLQRLAAIFKYIGHRPGDMAARYGADEFVLLFQSTDANGAQILADRIIERTKQQVISHQASKISEHVTLSIGGYVMIPTRSVASDEMIRQADKALYEAKKAGGNRIVIHG